jgi:mono/diheme cytochrome c family protein
MGIRRLALAGSLCAVFACGSDGSDIPEPVTANVPPSGSDGPFGQDPSAGGGVVGGIAGGVAGFGGFGGSVGIGRGPGVQPVRLTELRTTDRPLRPISGGSLAVTPDGSYAVAADPDRDTIYVIKTDSLSVTKLELPAGSEPGRVVLDPAGAAHVVLRGSGSLVRVDLAAGRVAGEATLCSQARGVAFDAARGALVAACMDGNLVTLKASDYTELSRTYVASDLRDVVVGSGGRIFVSRYRSAELFTLDVAGAVQAVNRAKSARASRFDFPLPSMHADPAQAPLAPEAFEISFSPTMAWRATPGQNGEVWMLHQESQDDEVSAAPGGYSGSGSPCVSITKGAVTHFASDGTPRSMSGIALQGLSVDLASSAAGDWLAVASPGGYLPGGQTLQLYATASMTEDVSQDFCVGPQLFGGGSSQVIAVAFDAAGLLYSFSREPVELEILSLADAATAGLTRVATITLDRRSMRDTGHDLFHTDVGSGLACASCHGEALDDGHVWTFAGIGPRRTQNMRGGLLQTAPFHWDGDMTSFKKLVDDVMTGRMGGFPVSDAYADALAHWIDAQPALQLPPPAGDAAAVARGKALFHGNATGCASCHSGASLTNNERVDVGTGGAFQVPSLRGLGLRAPYMHNGCATTIEERFDVACGGGDKHGTTSRLSLAEVADLSAYLRTL